MPDFSKNIDGKKFMWDGYVYETKDEAKKAENSYKENDFETEVLDEEGKYLVYTRRLVKEIVVEGEAPI